MISIVITLAMVLVVSIAMGVVASKKTEECIPVVFLGTIVILYGFYCFDLLTVGRIVLYAAFGVIVLAAVFFISSKRFKGKVFESIFTPEVVFFLALSIFFICFLCKMKPSVWDELRLWAAAPKALHFSESLQVGDGSLLYSTMQSYPPGMSLLTYFFTALTNSYFDGAPFIVETIFMCALVVPCFKNISFRKWKIIIPSMVVFLLIPIVLSINGNLACGDYAYYYLSLFIDPCLGFVLGSALFCALNRPFRSWFNTIHFSLLLFVLPCLKNTGAMFAAIVFAGAFVIYLFDRKYKGLDFLRGTISIFCVAVSYFSWQLIINTRGTGEFIDFNVSEFTAEKFVNVLKGITSWGYLPFLWIIIFFLAVDIFITLYFKDYLKRDGIIIVLAILVACLFFFYGYISHYGIRLSSIHRYTQSFTFASFVYLFMRGIRIVGIRECSALKETGWSDSRKKIRNAYVTFLIEFAVLLASVFVLLGYKKLQYPNKYIDEGNEYVNKWAFDIGCEEDVADCYLLLGGDIWSSSQMHESYYYCSIGSGLRIKNIWCDNFYNAAEIEYIEEDAAIAKAFKKNLYENGYDYVLIAKADDDISRVFKFIDKDIILRDGMVLKVILTGDSDLVGFEIIN